MSKFVTTFLIAIGLIILVFVIIFKAAGNKTPVKPPVSLSSYASTNASVKLTIDGVIGADQTHRAIKISVDSSSAQVEVLRGYHGNVERAKTYNNNAASFAVFLRALNFAGFTKGDSSPTKSDERGQCATGQRYIFEIVQGAEKIQRYWATSCGGSGTYRGNLTNTLDLFERQIPEYDDFTSGVNLN